MDGLNTHSNREFVGNLTEGIVQSLFDSEEVLVVPFGVGGISNSIKDEQDKRDFLNYCRLENVYNKPASMIVNYSPDFILFKKSNPQDIFFLETKCSVTPCWAPARIQKIRKRHPNSNLNESNIGEIAREPLMAYRRYYPNTIFLYGTPYNSKILMAQFADRIECLYCYKRQGEYNCNNCPAKNNGFFELERIENAGGSATPNTNINLDSFLDVKEFFRQLGIGINEESLENIQASICDHGVTIPADRVDVEREMDIRNILIENGCTWIDRISVYYSAPGNNFFHKDPHCFTLHDQGQAMYRSEQEANKARKTRCKFCARSN